MLSLASLGSTDRHGLYKIAHHAARRVLITSRSRQHVDKSTALLNVINFAQSSPLHGASLVGGDAPPSLEANVQFRLGLSLLMKLASPERAEIGQLPCRHED